MDKKTEQLLKLAEWAESQGWECDGRTVSDGIIRILRGDAWRA
jgi:hypothetical protein